MTQRYYAQQGVITPEMEFVAIRENLAGTGFQGDIRPLSECQEPPDEAAEALETLTMMPRPSELEAQEGLGRPAWWPATAWITSMPRNAGTAAACLPTLRRIRQG
ncbi:MAG: hypothetical protein ACLT38_12895 [Akkermansia sp.]